MARPWTTAALLLSGALTAACAGNPKEGDDPVTQAETQTETGADDFKLRDPSPKEPEPPPRRPHQEVCEAGEIAEALAKKGRYREAVDAAQPVLDHWTAELARDEDDVPCGPKGARAKRAECLRQLRAVIARTQDAVSDYAALDANAGIALLAQATGEAPAEANEEWRARVRQRAAKNTLAHRGRRDGRELLQEGFEKDAALRAWHEAAVPVFVSVTSDDLDRTATATIEQELGRALRASGLATTPEPSAAKSTLQVEASWAPYADSAVFRSSNTKTYRLSLHLTLTAAGERVVTAASSTYSNGTSPAHALRPREDSPWGDAVLERLARHLLIAVDRGQM